jgi:hypothetical protein
VDLLKDTVSGLGDDSASSVTGTAVSSDGSTGVFSATGALSSRMYGFV